MIRADFVLSLVESVQVTDLSSMAVIGNEDFLLNLTGLLPFALSQIHTFKNMDELFAKSSVDKLKFDLFIIPFDEFSENKIKHTLKKLLDTSLSDACYFLTGKFYSNTNLVSDTELTDFIRTCRLLNLNFSITKDSEHNYAILLRKIAFNQNKALEVYFSEMSKNIYERK